MRGVRRRTAGPAHDAEGGGGDEQRGSMRRCHEGVCRIIVKAKLLPYKYPREITFIEELPKTGTGKIDRQARDEDVVHLVVPAIERRIAHERLSYDTASANAWR